MHGYMGKEVRADVYGVKASLLDDIEYLEGLVKKAVEEANMTLVEMNSHKFSPYGVTTVAILAESHLAIHTWPENGYAAIDCFTCGEKGNPDRAVEIMIKELRPSKSYIVSSQRGDMKEIALHKEYALE